MLVRFQRDQFNEPNRTDYYLMQIAAEIENLFSKKPVSLDKKKIKFRSVKSIYAIPKEQRCAFAKARWFGMLGIKKDGRRDSGSR